MGSFTLTPPAPTPFETSRLDGTDESEEQTFWTRRQPSANMQSRADRIPDLAVRARLVPLHLEDQNCESAVLLEAPNPEKIKVGEK